MPRLIDANELWKHKFKSASERMDLNVAYMEGWNDAIDSIVENAPTVDAVEVVRCRDCKWWDEDDNDLYGYCMAMKHGYMSANWEIGIYRKYKGNFYCADGERREDDT